MVGAQDSARTPWTARGACTTQDRQVSPSRAPHTQRARGQGAARRREREGERVRGGRSSSLSGGARGRTCEECGARADVL